MFYGFREWNEEELSVDGVSANSVGDSSAGTNSTEAGSVDADMGQTVENRRVTERSQTADNSQQNQQQDCHRSKQNSGDNSADREQAQDEKMEEYGQMTLDGNHRQRKIHLLSIIGEVEGHENLSGSAKTTKYDHVLPQLAQLEDDDSVDGLLVLLNTSGGDVDAGLAIAEMISSLSMPSVSLVLGGSHSIGVPLAVSTDYSFIVPTGTMMIHPVRMSGMVIGASQTYEYFEMIQDRILSFVSTHSKIAYDQARRLMLNTEMLTRDLGTVLVGEESVKEGLIDEVGGIRDALKKLYSMIDEEK